MKKVEHLNRCNHRNRPLRIDSGCAACEIESLREERRNLSRKNRELMILSDHVNQVREYCQSAGVGRLGDIATAALIKDHKRLRLELAAIKSQYRNYRNSIRAHLEEIHASSVSKKLVTNDVLSRLRSIQNDCAQYAAGSDIIRDAADLIEQLLKEKQ